MMLKYQPRDQGSAAAIVSGKALEKQSGRNVLFAISPRPADEDAHAAPCGEMCIRHPLAQATFTWRCCFRIIEFHCKVVDAQTTKKMLPTFLRTGNNVAECRRTKAHHDVDAIFLCEAAQRCRASEVKYFRGATTDVVHADHVFAIFANVCRISLQCGILCPAAMDAYLHLDTPVPHLAVIWLHGIEM